MFEEYRSNLGKQGRKLLWRFTERLHRRRVSDRPSTSDRSLDGRTATDNAVGERLSGDARSGWSIPFDRPIVPSYPYYEDLSGPTGFRPLENTANPVLTVDAVTDFGDAHFVADPFLMGDPEGTLHMFFEVFNRNRTPTAAIGHATSMDGGRVWSYNRIVLEEPVHLSFPYVFRYAGEYYMIPDKWVRQEAAPIDLYRADSFPEEWTPVARITDPDQPLHDFVAFRWQDRWWGIAGDGSNMAVFHADELESDDWEPHPENPVVTDRPRGARPAGRPLVRRDHVDLFVQDCSSMYGERVRAFRVRRLSRTEYDDVEREDSPILEPSDERLGWNSGQMHHIDPWYTGEEWLCAVDGNVNFRLGIFGENHWSIGLYTADEKSLDEPSLSPSPEPEHAKDDEQRRKEGWSELQ